MSSVHTRYDTRIFLKECSSLALVNNYNVNLIVADGKGDEIKNDVHIYDMGKPGGRLSRVIKTTKLVLNKAIELDSDIYHFHDPELIPTGMRLVKLGKRVIFDVHENIAEQIQWKSYLPRPLRLLLSAIYKLYERRFVKSLVLILAENSYAEHFKKITKNYTIVLNMPQTGLLERFVTNNRDKVEFFYIGGISEIRGVYLLLDALSILRRGGITFKMHFVGSSYGVEINMEKYEEIKTDIIFHGALELSEGYKISNNCMIGLSILKPIGNYVTSYSTKIFEYMAIKLPVITSNFPLYQEVVGKFNCGICVDPMNPQDIANAMQYIIDNPEIARLMGKNGKQAIEHKYNWDIEQNKLFDVYDNLLSHPETGVISSRPD
jgi:glycosyltransferase involved in cell wall biosynthesis